MFFAKRDAQDRITALAEQPEPDFGEAIDIGHPDVIAFLRGAAEPAETVRRRLSESDAEMARVTEDLIDVLVARGTLLFTELPPAAQEKLIERRRLRQSKDPDEPLMRSEEEVI